MLIPPLLGVPQAVPLSYPFGEKQLFSKVIGSRFWVQRLQSVDIFFYNTILNYNCINFLKKAGFDAKTKKPRERNRKQVLQ